MFCWSHINHCFLLRIILNIILNIKLLDPSSPSSIHLNLLLKASTVPADTTSPFTLHLHCILGIQIIADVVSRGRLRWFVHLEHRSGSLWMIECWQGRPGLNTEKWAPPKFFWKIKLETIHFGAYLRQTFEINNNMHGLRPYSIAHIHEKIKINPLRTIGLPVTHENWPMNWPNFAASPALLGWPARNRHTAACIHRFSHMLRRPPVPVVWFMSESRAVANEHEGHKRTIPIISSSFWMTVVLKGLIQCNFLLAV